MKRMFFERHGDVKSIPRDGRPKDEVHPDIVGRGYQMAFHLELQRKNIFLIAQVMLGPFQGMDYPNHPMSLTIDGSDTERRRTVLPSQCVHSCDGGRTTRDAKFEPEDEPDFDWSADKEPNQDWSGAKSESDFHAEQPFYDWSGARPEKLRAAPPPEQPDMDWSADKPEDSWHKVDEPHCDWAGARPEGPFDRRSVTTHTNSK